MLNLVAVNSTDPVQTTTSDLGLHCIYPNIVRVNTVIEVRFCQSYHRNKCEYIVTTINVNVSTSIRVLKLSLHCKEKELYGSVLVPGENNI